MSMTYSKCKRFKDRLEKHGLDTGNSVFYGNGSPTDNPENVTWCQISGNDRQLEDLLEKKNKMGFVRTSWSSNNSIEFNANGVESTDIIVNLANCARRRSKHDEMRWEHIDLRSLPASCKLEAVHVHNKDDVNAAVHLHLACSDSSFGTMDGLADFIVETNLISWDMCGKRPKGKGR